MPVHHHLRLTRREVMVSTDLAHPQVLASVGVPSRTSTVVNWRGLSGESGRLGQLQQPVPILIPTSFPQISRCRNLSHRSCPPQDSVGQVGRVRGSQSCVRDVPLAGRTLGYTIHSGC
jgi:hypothetical protein